MNIIKIKCIKEDGATIPLYKTAGAAGADLCAKISQPLTIKAGKFAMVPTGLYFEIPEGYEVQVRPRSGLAAKNGVTVLNTPGTIDSDYRGEIKVPLYNQSGSVQTIEKGERIVQMVITPFISADFTEVDELDDTLRGAEGFGSTGRK